VQSESCPYGIDGWLLWTWDTEEQTELWNGLSGDRTIDRALAPATRPDPCAQPTGPRNVAVGKPATASRSLLSNPPSLAVDGLRDTLWIAGDFAPQSLEIDLQGSFSVSRIRLAVAQTPAGPTTHRLYVRQAGSTEYQLVREFSGITSEGDVLEHAFPAPRPGVRFVRVETVATPSWVSWREIEVVASGS
jgi:F5/8 type C domain